MSMSNQISATLPNKLTKHYKAIYRFYCHVKNAEFTDTNNEFNYIYSVKGTLKGKSELASIGRLVL